MKRRKVKPRTRREDIDRNPLRFPEARETHHEEAYFPDDGLRKVSCGKQAKQFNMDNQ